MAPREGAHTRGSGGFEHLSSLVIKSVSRRVFQLIPLKGGLSQRVSQECREYRKTPEAYVAEMKCGWTAVPAAVEAFPEALKKG